MDLDLRRKLCALFMVAATLLTKSWPKEHEDEGIFEEEFSEGYSGYVTIGKEGMLGVVGRGKDKDVVLVVKRALFLEQTAEAGVREGNDWSRSFSGKRVRY